MNSNGKSNDPLVSVLMTCYNREKYIGDAIQSVLSSTYGNLELIIVDDRSKDNTVAIAESFAAKDDRIRVYRNEINLGDYPNRNRAASYARGKYIKYLDSDDMLYPFGLEIMVYWMEKYPECALGLEIFSAYDDKPFPFELTGEEAYKMHYCSNNLPIFSVAPGSAIIKKACFDAVGGFPEKRNIGDYEMWHILARQYKILAMRDVVYWSRIHEDQQMEIRRKDIIEASLYYKVTLDNLEHSPLEPGLQQRIYNKVHRAAVRNYMRHYFSITKEQRRQYKNAFTIGWGDMIKAVIKKQS
jgi:glycosyltransferase involved in cell wall biosynthesis